ncbi:MAG: trypsin-like peptidase domain-containing protein [Candidatus Moranbacteria bacterium]|nr:trypsin-like peptidase domain-containing protein [Candidatus Moranbacteria bacterium]
MEQDVKKLNSDLPSEGQIPSSKSVQSVDWEGRKREGLKFFVFLLVSSIFGFVGGVTAPQFNKMLHEQSSMFPWGSVGENPEKNNKPGRQEATSSDDRVIVGLVEHNAAGVVSIVISKDVPKVRNFFQNPFFFDPFNTREQGSRDSGATEKQQVGNGSGFIVSQDGLLVTNKHVVSDTAAEYMVITSDGKEYGARVLGRDPMHDIAILKIDGNDFPSLDLGDSDQVKVGQTVIAIGNPLGEFANSVTRGIISGVQREVSAGSGSGRSEQLSGIFQTDAAINPGNSGGPLFNLSGEVIGVNVAMARGAENIAFALPINQVKRTVEQVKTNGKISTPYIGVRYLSLNEVIAKENDLPLDHGALVIRGEKMTDFAVVPGSPADKAGIMENDILLSIDGAKIDEKHQLANLISEKNVNDEITVEVWHKGEMKEVKVKLEERK